MNNIEVKRINILGTYISIITLNRTIQFLKNYPYSKHNYICLPNVYVTVCCHYENNLRKILNNSLLTLPDGKPLEIYAKSKGIKNIGTVSGYWLIKSLLTSDLSHYFYGANEQTLALLKNKLDSEFPDAKILGYSSPPFLNQNKIKFSKTIINDIKKINSLKPDIIWIGLSSPKQDILMYHHHHSLDHGLMIGVGAVFDYLAGTVKISPEWIKKLSLRWLYRLIKEPRRLWKRYLYSNSIFLYLVIKEIFFTTFSKLSFRNN